MNLALTPHIRGRFRHYVCWAALGFLPFVVTRRPDPFGVALIFGGAGLRAYASGFLDKEGRLCISGPFAFVRNPLYVGTLLIACGAAVTEDAWFALIGVVLCGLPVIYGVARAEETVLAEKFPKSYPRYRREVPRFFPRMTPFTSYRVLRDSPEVRARTFSRDLFRRNRGYEALIVAVGLTALIFGIYSLRIYGPSLLKIVRSSI